MNLRTRGWMGYCWLLILGLFLVSGCADPAPTGDQPINEPPVVQIVNIPPNQSFFTQNPEIFWYGTDIDGYIIAYEYLVIRTDTLISEGVDPYDEADLLAFAGSTDYEWSLIDVNSSEGSPTRQRIKLFAGENPDSAVEQVFFVRAVDDDSARSAIDFRLYSRSNHPPDTKVSVGGESVVFWDLPDTTSSYKGIKISWEGTDEFDFTEIGGAEPEFEFYFQLFGPYPYLDTTDLLGTMDTLDMSKLIATGVDTATGSYWLSADGITVFNLFRNEPQSDTTRTGWFVAKATARDDAFVPDPTPAYVAFKAVNPRFENELIVNLPTQLITSDIIGGFLSQETFQLPDGSTVTIRPLDSLKAYVEDVFTQAGYGDALFLWPEDDVRLPDRELLARYRNYIVLDDGAAAAQRLSTLTKGHFDVLAEYMDLGGNVMVWAPIPFVAFGSAQTPKYVGFSAQDMPVKYFDVKGMYFPLWDKSYSRWSLAAGCVLDTCPELIQGNEQFIKALAIQGKGFENLTPDLDRLLIYWVKRDSLNYPYPFRGAPATAYFARDLFSEPLLLIDSYYGDFVPDSLKQYVESLQGRVCGLRYDARTFKSAVFGFSWYLLPKEQTVGIIEKMMAWFKE